MKKSWDSIKVGDRVTESTLDKHWREILEVGASGKTVLLSAQKDPITADKLITIEKLKLLGLHLEGEEEKWVPKEGETYFFPSPENKDLVDEYCWDDDNVDQTLLSRNLVCRTREEAEEKARKMLEAIK